MEFIDAHVHLNHRDFSGDRTDCVRRARAAGVQAMVNPGTHRRTSEQAAELAARFDEVWAAAGVHPHSAADTGEDWTWLEDLLRREEVLALGECGLDYHYDFSPRAVQRRVFSEQLRLARSAGVPVVVHSREADDDCLRILERELPPGHPVLLHCFGGDVQMMERAVDRGYWLSLGGIVTFDGADEMRRVAAQVPHDHLMLETDAPYLAPVPRRGRRNEPAHVQYVARRIAELRDEPLAEIARTTTSAAETFYDHPLQ